jgi:2-amino-4-hydroxy-6-hydroxymethyldihydropteridine diphosphokinase
VSFIIVAVMRVVLGLGGNVGDSRRFFSDCLISLAADGLIMAVSRLWRTRAVGPSQPNFLNAAALIDWPAGPRSLLRRCRELEALAGRDRTQEERWGPRILDLDLLIAASVVCRGPHLEIPHPRLHERRFALEPAAEIVADWVHPALGLTIEALVEAARRNEPDAILEVMSFEF